MKVPPEEKRKTITTAMVISMMLATIVYMCVGLMGADMFGNSITDNILEDFTPCNEIWMTICALIYAVAVIISCPILLFSVKVSMIKLMKRDPETKQGYCIGLGISAVFILLGMGLAMILDSILTILGIFASVAGIVFYFSAPICLEV